MCILADTTQYLGLSILILFFFPIFDFLSFFLLICFNKDENIKNKSKNKNWLSYWN